jgi:catechol 2,3-dioxygenase
VADSAEPGAAPTLSAGVRIGHVHLKVADLDRALRFYRDVLGFQVTQRYGSQAVFLSAAGGENYHHHIGLNTWHSRSAGPAPVNTAGLYHLAILFPTRAELAAAVRRVLAAGIPLEGASDHGVSEAVYLRDPDGNGVELYRDRPPAEWPRDGQGGIAMTTDPLDLPAFLAEAPAA